MIIAYTFFNSHSTAEGKLQVAGEEEEDVCSYWITLRKTDNTELEVTIGLCGELTLEEAMDLLQDRLCIE